MPDGKVVEGFRLSPQQERLWALGEQSRSGAYIAQCSVLIEGEIDQIALRAALESVVDRHEILRTRFCSIPGLIFPVQVIGRGEIFWSDYDLANVSAPKQQSVIESLLSQAIAPEFDYEHGPLIRVSWLKFTPKKQMLIITMPALCVDSDGLKKLLRDLASCYQATLEDRVQADETAQYADLSDALNELLESEETQAGRLYWRNQDYSCLHTLNPLFKKRPPSSAQFEPRSLTWSIDSRLCARIEQVSTQCKTSINILLLTCWAALLSRWAGQSEVMVGTMYAGCLYEGLERAIGPFEKHLPLTFKFDDNLCFDEALRQVKLSVAEAGRWQEYFNYEQVLASIEGSPSFIPHCFQYDERDWEEHVAGATFTIDGLRAYVDRFEIKLTCSRLKKGLITAFHYDGALFDDEEIHRLSEQFHKLLESAISHPRREISDLDMVGESELRRLLIEFNETQAEDERPHLIHRLVERQVARTPHKIAVVFEHKHLTYAELDAQANRLAQYLMSLGVGPERLVAICVERSIEMLIGLLGILKAGGAYVPLDPGYPKDRLNFMLENAKADLLLTQEDILEQLPDHGLQEICLDRDSPRWSGESDSPPACGLTDENLAYAIYTSGSTGRPKGVMISHRAISNRLLWMMRRYPLDEWDSLLQKTPFSFDASIWELFTPLMSGAKLIMARPGGHKDSRYLMDVIAENGVTTLQLVPSMLRGFLAEEGLERCARLRQVYCGGEALPAELEEKLFDRLTADLHNLYGPTEASIDVSHQECQRGRSREYAIVPIGRPIANTRIYLLSDRMRPVPIGVAAELYATGVGLARGYWNRPDLTAERFVPNAFGNDGDRLYRTGDLARYAPDGTIHFLGRIDDQVKIRGYRIELGEIESSLCETAGVAEAVVLARESKQGENRLVAYVAPAKGDALRASEIKRSMRERLPEYMVPSVFVTLEALPRAPNGKLDRRALPDPTQAAMEGGGIFHAPRTPTEELLMGVFHEVLNLERADIYDDFFDLGGHSLLAMQIVSRVREVFEVELPLRSIFESPTVAGLAEKIEARCRADRRLQPPPVARVAREEALPLSFGQQRLWFLHQLNPDSSAFNISIPLRVKGVLDVTALKRSVSEIIRRHEVLRTTFKTVGGEPFQEINEASPFNLSVEDLASLDQSERESEAKRLASEEASMPFDLEHGPMMRVRLLRLGEHDHVLLPTVHHIAGDAWSTGILMRELETLYNAFSAGRPSPLPEPAIQYADYAVWQREWLQGELLETYLSYWRKQLAPAPEALELPTDHERPSVMSFRGATEPLALSEKLCERLHELGKKEGVTLFMILLGAFQTLLHRYTGQEVIVVGSDIANRNWSETEQLIGFFVNQLVMCVDLSGDPSFSELLKRVKEVALDAYAHQDLPFEKLVEGLRPDRSLNHAPLFQVKLTLQNVDKKSLDLSGLSLELVEHERRTAQLDLIINIENTGKRIVGSIDYSTDLFEASTIKRMIERFGNLLNQVTAEPGRRLSELRILSNADTAGLAPEDFPDAELSVKDFEGLILEMAGDAEDLT